MASMLTDSRDKSLAVVLRLMVMDSISESVNLTFCARGIFATSKQPNLGKLKHGIAHLDHLVRRSSCEVRVSAFVQASVLPFSHAEWTTNPLCMLQHPA